MNFADNFSRVGAVEERRTRLRPAFPAHSTIPARPSDLASLAIHLLNFVSPETIRRIFIMGEGQTYKGWESVVAPAVHVSVPVSVVDALIPRFDRAGEAQRDGREDKDGADDVHLEDGKK